MYAQRIFKLPGSSLAVTLSTGVRSGGLRDFFSVGWFREMGTKRLDREGKVKKQKPDVEIQVGVASLQGALRPHTISPLHRSLWALLLRTS